MMKKCDGCGNLRDTEDADDEIHTMCVCGLRKCEVSDECTKTASYIPHKKPFLLELNDLIQQHGSNLMGSDGMVNGEPAFQWDFRLNEDKTGKNYRIYFTDDKA